MRPSRTLAQVLPFLLALAFGTSPAGAAEHFVTANPDNTFSPAALTIEVGDTVTWSNNGGTHNVAAADGSFRCAQGCDGGGGNGNPSSAAWSFSLTFDDPGVIDYICEVHVGLGMTGTITVEGGQPPAPGSLRFSTGALEVPESAGSRSVSVQRTGGADGEVSVLVTASGGSANPVEDFTPVAETLTWGDGDAAAKTTSVPIVADSVPEDDETVNLALSNPTGGATLGMPSAATLTIRDDDEPAEDDPGVVTLSSGSYSANESDGTVQVTAIRQGGDDGAVSVDLSSSDGSATEGLDYEGVDETLSWGDGQDGSRSVQVGLIDDGEEESAETVNLALSNPTGGLSIGSPGTATLTIGDDDVSSGPCVEDEVTLCLGEGDRFRARIDWISDQDSGPGRAVPLAAEESGLFYFFSENNIEMLLKVLDACVPTLGNRFWVFFAATTTVEFELEVLDTETGILRTYRNELGNPAAPVTDTEGFACD